MSNFNSIIAKSLQRQQQALLTKHPEGLTLITNSEDFYDIQADLIGPSATPYEKGVFRVKLCLSNDFPNTPPKAYFLTKIYHPNVSTSGEICVNTLKKEWNPKNWSLYNVFEVIRCLLIVPFPESSLNEDAGRLFMENYNEYFKRASLFTNIHCNKDPNEDRREGLNEKSQLKEDVEYFYGGDSEFRKQSIKSYKTTEIKGSLFFSSDCLGGDIHRKEKMNLGEFNELNKGSTSFNVSRKQSLNSIQTGSQKNEELKKWLARI